MMRTRIVLVLAMAVALACALGTRAAPVSAKAQYDWGVAAVVQPPYELMEVFSVGDDGAVRDVWKEHNSAWRPPYNLTGPGFASPGSPVAAVFQPRNNQVEVFVISSDGVLWDIWKANNGPWQPPIKLSDTNFAPAGAGISAVFEPRNDQLEVFVIDRSGALRDVWKANNGPWSSPLRLSNDGFVREGQKLSAVYYPNGEQLEVFVVGNDGILRGLWKPKGGSWKADVTLTAPGFASPRASVTAVYQPRNEQLEVFVIAKDGSLWDAWKAKGASWQPAIRLTDANSMRETMPLAAVSQALGDNLEVFSINDDGALRNSFKTRNGPWQRPNTLTGIYMTPLVTAGACTNFFQRWHNGFDDPFLMDQCVWVMGIEEYCRSVGGYSTVEFLGTDVRANNRRLICVPFAHPDSPIEQIEHIARGTVEGLVTAYVAAAPYLGAVVSGAACVSGVIYACATLALEVASLAGASPPGVAGDAVKIASTVAKCVDSNIGACAALGLQGARDVGLKIPGKDAARIADDAGRCANQEFAACVRLGLAAADAAGVRTGSAALNVTRIRACTDGVAQACLALGQEAAQAVGLPLDSLIDGAETARACAAGDTAACIKLGNAVLADAGIKTRLSGGEVARIQGCLNGTGQACLALGQEAASAAGMPLKGVVQGVERAQNCAYGNSAACVELGKAMVGSAVAGGVENAQRCATGDNGACTDLGTGLVGSGLAQDADKALRCEHGEFEACSDIGRALVARAG